MRPLLHRFFLHDFSFLRKYDIQQLKATLYSNITRLRYNVRISKYKKCCIRTKLRNMIKCNYVQMMP